LFIENLRLKVNKKNFMLSILLSQSLSLEDKVAQAREQKNSFKA